MAFHNPLGLAHRPSTMSSTNDSSAMQLGTSDKKDLESRTQTISQTLTEGTKAKGATIKLVSSPKSSHPRVIPSYNYASKYPQNGKVEKSLSTHARQIARGTKFKHADPNKSLSQARRGKANKQPVDDEEAFNFTDLPQVTVIPATMLTLESAPTEGDAFYFSGVVKGYTTFDRHCVNGEKPAFLELPIASGDCWSGVRVHLLTLKGRTKKKIRFFHKATWGEVLERLYPKHPTGTNFDVDIEDDDDPDNYWEFYKVEFELL